jgi:beta-lactamase class A
MKQIRHVGFRRVGEVLSAWRDGHPRLFWGLLATLVLILAVQLLYPGDRALPFSRLGGDMVGLSSHQDVAKNLQSDYSKTSVTTTIRGKKVTTPLAETGITTYNKQILSGLSTYEWYWRIVPLSIVVKGALTDQPVVTRTDDARFSMFAIERAKECKVEPKNAGVVVKDGEVQLDPAKDGEQCSEQSLQRQLTTPELKKSGLSVTVKTTAVKPDRSDADVQPLLMKAKSVAEHKLTLAVAGKSYSIDKPTLASWLAFPEDPATKQPTLGINAEAVKAYLATIQKDVYIAPGVTVITTKDSIETGRVPGASGRGINQEATTSAIEKQVLAGDGTVEATLAVLPPTLKYNRSYSKTPEGLQALINDIVKDKGDFAISVRKLGDTGVHANGDKQYHPASTYKLFVAYSVLKRVDLGQMSLGQTTSGGQTLAQCLDNMIVYSDNACAEWFGQAIGWNTLTADARALGAGRTVLSRPFVSTANDQALFLQKLESNQLALTEPSRARLLDAMKRQVFRKGIPAGVGVPVADKVGFIPDEGLFHDSAIVYAPGGVYVLVIYTQGSNWAAIADAAKQIHAQLQ